MKVKSITEEQYEYEVLSFVKNPYFPYYLETVVEINSKLTTIDADKYKIVKE